MKRISKIHEFQARVGVLMFDDFKSVEIVPDARMGFFDPPSERRLVEFCKSHPEFHIVSLPYDDYHFNFHFVGPGTILYMLANGDPDPELYFAPCLTFDEYLDLRVAKVWKDKF